MGAGGRQSLNNGETNHYSVMRIFNYENIEFSNFVLDALTI